MKKIKLWEVLVPERDNAGKLFRIKHHRKLDKRIRKLSGGLTILKSAKGQWVHETTKKVVAEKMIPVRFHSTKKEAKKIGCFTRKHYNQEKVLVYEISNEVLEIEK